ncbi:MAG: PilZ domain-containing protein [Planctomycetota bacterium]
MSTAEPGRIRPINQMLSERARTGRRLAQDEQGAAEEIDPRRAHARHEWRQLVQVAFLVNSTPMVPMSLMAVDLSRGGLGLISKNMVHPGTIGIAMLRKTGSEFIVRAVEVVHCRYVQPRQHMLGTRWTSVPSHLRAEVAMAQGVPTLQIRAA